MKSINKLFLIPSSLLIMAASLSSCDSDIWEFKDKNKGAYIPDSGDPIATTLSKNGEYEEWVNLLNYSGTYSALNQGTDGVVFTAFVPTDSAVHAFLRDNGYSSIEDMSREYAAALVKQHTYQGDSMKIAEMFTPVVNTIGFINSNGQMSSITVDAGSDDGGFLLNDKIHVNRTYSVCSNGFYYEINALGIPLVETVADRIQENPDYSLFYQALEASGYDKELDILADTTITMGSKNITQRSYTLLAVSNATFQKAGINSLTDLANALAARTEASVSSDSLIKQYVEYHLMSSAYTVEALEEMLSVSDTLRVWATMAPNQILLATGLYDADSIYTLYLNKEDVAAQYVAANSNVLAKNGIVHEISSWLPVYEPAQSTVVWDLADYPAIREAAGLVYRPAEPVSSETKTFIQDLSCFKFELGPNGYSNNSYAPITYVTCKSNLKNCMYNDRVVFNLGYQGYVEMQTPTMVRGRYKVTLSMAYLTELAFIRTSSGCKGGMIKISMDGENEQVVAPYTTITKSLAGVYEATLWEEIEFDATSSHTFKFVVMDPAASTNSKFSLQFDAITFTPIED